MKKFAVLLAMLAVLLLAASAEAVSIGINFTNGTDPMTVSGSAGVVAQSNWNNLQPDGGEAWGECTWVDGSGDYGRDSKVLNYSTGLSTSTTVVRAWYSQGSGGGWGVGTWGGTPGTIVNDNDRLYNGALQSAEAAQITINGIPAALTSTTYDVISAAMPDSLCLTVGGVSKRISTFTSLSSGFVEATLANSWTGNYLKWSGLSAASLNVTFTDGYDNGGKTAFVQLVGVDAVVPEPAGLGLIGLALLAVRKRRS